MNYYRRYVGDYIRDTGDLSLTEHGAYNLLIDYCYATERPLPNEYERLYRICFASVPHEQEAVRFVADRFFPIVEGKRRHKRIEEELGKALPAIEEMRKAGLNGAKKRWGKNGAEHRVGHRVDDGDDDGVPHEEPHRVGDRVGGRVAIHPPSSILHPPSSKNQPPEKKIGAAQRSQGSRLPSDWRPSELLEVWARKERPDLNYDLLIEKFRDYWTAVPGAKGRKLDWEATFRNFVRTERAGVGAAAPDYSKVFSDAEG